jgi:hypothetical protein
MACGLVSSENQILSKDKDYVISFNLAMVDKKISVNKTGNKIIFRDKGHYTITLTCSIPISCISNLIFCIQSKNYEDPSYSPFLNSTIISSNGNVSCINISTLIPIVKKNQEVSFHLKPEVDQYIEIPKEIRIVIS